MKSSARCNQQRYGARRDLPNRVTTRKSLNKPSHYKSQIPFVSDTFIFYWVIAKYYLLDFTIPFFPSHHFVYGGVLEINRTVVVYLPTYISMHRTRVEFLVP